MSTKNGVPFRVINLPQSMYEYKCPYYMTPTEITVHNTDNEMPAINEINYMHSNYNETSYHIAVDEKEAIQGLPFNRNGWHSGDGGSGRGNRHSIGVEICRNYDRTRNTTYTTGALAQQYKMAEENAVKVIAQLCIDFNIVASKTTIRSHKERSGKNCPSKMYNEGRWEEFRQRVIDEYNRLKGKPVVKGDKVEAVKPKPKPAVASKVVSVKESDRFYPNTEIFVRDQPTVAGKHVATYYSGEYVDYHTRHDGNGYVWLQYDRMKGKKVIGQGYIPCRKYSNGKYGTMWGHLQSQRKNTVEKEFIFLPANNKTWGVYYLHQAPVTANIQGKYLAPAQFGGIEYEVVKWAQPNIAVINTGTFGQVKIYVGSDTNAKIYKKQVPK